MAEVLLVPAGIEAYGLYQRASLYCCPSSYGLPRRDVDRIAFYAQGIMVEFPLILRIVEGVDPRDASAHAGTFSDSEEGAAAVTAALRRWHATFSAERTNVASRDRREPSGRVVRIPSREGVQTRSQGDN